MKENKATGHKSTFWPHFFLLLFGTFVAVLSLGQKKTPIFENHISKYKTKFGTSNYKFMLHMTLNLLFFLLLQFKSFFSKETFLGKIGQQTRFYNWGPSDKCVHWIMSLF